MTPVEDEDKEKDFEWYPLDLEADVFSIALVAIVNESGSDTVIIPGSDLDPEREPKEKAVNLDAFQKYRVYAAGWALLSLLIEYAVVIAILREMLMSVHCPETEPIAAYWELNGKTQKTLIAEGYDSEYYGYDSVPSFHQHVKEEPGKDWRKSGSRVLAIFIVGMSVGQELMDIVTNVMVMYRLSKESSGMLIPALITCITGQKTSFGGDDKSWVEKQEEEQAVKLEKLRALRATITTQFVLFTSYLRFVLACGVYVMSFVIIKDADTVLDVWKDCVAIVFITEIDSLLFSAMKKGMLGRKMLKCARNMPEVLKIKVLCVEIKKRQSPEDYQVYWGLFNTACSVIMMALMVAHEVNTGFFMKAVFTGVSGEVSAECTDFDWGRQDEAYEGYTR